MTPTTADEIADRVLALLKASPDRPAGLQDSGFTDSPDMPVELEGVPVLGVYIEDGDRLPGEEDTIRTCTLRVEVRAPGRRPLAATRAIRSWVLKEICGNPQLVVDGLPTVLTSRYLGFLPFAGFASSWLGGSVLDFEFTYRWETFEF